MYLLEPLATLFECTVLGAFLFLFAAPLTGRANLFLQETPLVFNTIAHALWDAFTNAVGALPYAAALAFLVALLTRANLAAQMPTGSVDARVALDQYLHLWLLCAALRACWSIGWFYYHAHAIRGGMSAAGFAAIAGDDGNVTALLKKDEPRQ